MLGLFMVDFQLDEMQAMLKELANEFARDEVRPKLNTGTKLHTTPRKRFRQLTRWVC